jgi:hypothetical protein
MEKMTKKDFYNKIKTLVTDTDVIDFCDKEIAALDAKAAKAKERAAKKAAAGDALLDAIAAVLTDEPMTLTDIVDALGMDGVTVNKVSARGATLVANGLAVKTEVAVPDADGKNRKRVAYTKA